MAGVTKSISTKRERREALERMTKAELVKTVVALDARQTKLLNRIAQLEHSNLTGVCEFEEPATSEVFADPGDAGRPTLPWE